MSSRKRPITRTPHGYALLNVGCGVTFSPEWTNVDLSAIPPHVVRVDLRKPLPFPDDGFDAVYSSHVLEHFSRDAGASLVREMVRCLAPGGICRIVVPDFEALCREYLAQIDAAHGAAEARRHEWALVNVVDQFVREQWGGRMRELIAAGDIDEDYVRHANGDELLDMLCDESRQPALARTRVGRFLAAKLTNPRRTGELHRWAYDRVSLARTMSSCGLESVAGTTHDGSKIPEWSRYALDSDKSGRPRKPGSLFMEGRKPVA